MSVYRATITISVAVEAASELGASYLAHDFLRAIEDAAPQLAPEAAVEWDGSGIDRIAPHPWRS